MTVLPAGAAVVSTAQQCAQIALARGAIIEQYRRLGGMPAGLLEHLDVMADAARRARMDLSLRPSSAAGSGSGSAVVPMFDHALAGVDAAEYMSVQDAAKVIGIGARGVRKALSKEQPDLVGRHRGGEQSVWEVDVSSAVAYADRRRARRGGAA